MSASPDLNKAKPFVESCAVILLLASSKTRGR